MSATKTAEKRVMFSVRLDPEMAIRLEELAETAGCSTSKIVRDLLEAAHRPYVTNQNAQFNAVQRESLVSEYERKVFVNIGPSERGQRQARSIRDVIDVLYHLGWRPPAQTSNVVRPGGE